MKTSEDRLYNTTVEVLPNRVSSVRACACVMSDESSCWLPNMPYFRLFFLNTILAGLILVLGFLEFPVLNRFGASTADIKP